MGTDGYLFCVALSEHLGSCIKSQAGEFCHQLWRQRRKGAKGLYFQGGQGCAMHAHISRVLRLLYRPPDHSGGQERSGNTDLAEDLFPPSHRVVMKTKWATFGSHREMCSFSFI